VVGTGILYLNEDNQPLGYSIPPTEHSIICHEPCRLLRIGHGTIVGKKSWFEKYPYDENIKLAEDFNLFLRAYKGSKFSNVPEPLYYYRLKSVFKPKDMIVTRIGSAKFIYRYCLSQGTPFKAIYYGSIQIVKLLAGLIYCTMTSRHKYLARRYKTLTKEQYGNYCRQIREIENIKLPLKSVK